MTPSGMESWMRENPGKTVTVRWHDRKFHALLDGCYAGNGATLYDALLGAYAKYEDAKAAS